MNWISALHYGVILQQERLRHARESYRWISGQAAYKWLQIVREMRIRRGHRLAKTALTRGLALTKGGSAT